VHADDLILNYCADGHGIEALSEDLPDLNAVATLTYTTSTRTFIVETIELVD
jgi:hypothetical protein